MNPAHWILTADARRASLFSCERTPGGSLHVEQLREIGNSHEDEHERHRPYLLNSPLGHGHPKGASAAAPHLSSPSHAREEEEARFAREVASWLKAACHDLGINAATGKLHAFVAPHFLGVLRTKADLDPRFVDTHAEELTRLLPHELAVHPAVARSLSAPPALRG